MILGDLQGYLSDNGRASLSQLELRFGVQPSALRAMLDRLVAKGRVRRLAPPMRCVGCTLCPEEALELYEWTAAPATDEAPSCGPALAPGAAVARCPHCG